MDKLNTDLQFSNTTNASHDDLAYVKLNNTNEPHHVDRTKILIDRMVNQYLRRNSLYHSHELIRHT